MEAVPRRLFTLRWHSYASEWRKRSDATNRVIRIRNRAELFSFKWPAVERTAGRLRDPTMAPRQVNGLRANHASCRQNRSNRPPNYPDRGLARFQTGSHSGPTAPASADNVRQAVVRRASKPTMQQPSL
jgi:hypothetical protein